LPNSSKHGIPGSGTAEYITKGSGGKQLTGSFFPLMKGNRKLHGYILCIFREPHLHLSALHRLLQPDLFVRCSNNKLMGIIC
jgi:hypothetical protein